MLGFMIKIKASVLSNAPLGGAQSHEAKAGQEEGKTRCEEAQACARSCTVSCGDGSRQNPLKWVGRRQEVGERLTFFV